MVEEKMEGGKEENGKKLETSKLINAHNRYLEKISLYTSTNFQAYDIQKTFVTQHCSFLILSGKTKYHKHFKACAWIQTVRAYFYHYICKLHYVVPSCVVILGSNKYRTMKNVFFLFSAAILSIF